jgi:hypothetical protein
MERAVLGAGANDTGTGPLPNFTEVAGVDTARHIAVGRMSGCAVLEDRTARCWRRLETSNAVVGPEDIGLTGIVSIAAKSTDHCVSFEDTTVRCWRGDGPSNSKQIFLP